MYFRCLRMRLFHERWKLSWISRTTCRKRGKVTHRRYRNNVFSFTVYGEVVSGFHSRYGLNTYVKRVSQRSTESRGFSPGTPAGNVDRVGWDKPQTVPSTVAVLRDQIRVIRWLPEASLVGRQLDQVELRPS
jgi:hypothetical protein